MLERAMNIVAYRNFPDDVVKKFIYLAKKNGCDYFRIFDALNDLRNMEVPIKSVKECGGHAQGSLCYTISPVHTVERYVEQFMKLEKMGCDSLCIKDMAGMISPKRAYDIIKGCKDAGIKRPINLHTHCTSGMTGMAYMRACQAEVDILDTAISPISGGTAAPPTESIVAALKDTEWDTQYDLELLIEIRKYFLEIWSKYRHLHRINALKVDPSVAFHQIPGGMLSNLIFQLEEQGAGGKYTQILEETARVRKELGYPPLVTPTSQVIGVQAVMNVLHGRYKVIPKETKDYCRGMYGQPPAPIKKDIMRMVLGNNYEDQVIECRPADLIQPLWDKRKKELKEIDVSLIKKEEDIMTYTLYPQVGLKFLKGDATAEFTSKELPLPVTHKLTRGMVKSMFPEHKQIWLETIEPEKRQAHHAIPTEFDVEVNGEPFEVRVTPVGFAIDNEIDKKPIPETSAKIEGGIKSTMQGTILKIKVKEDDEIKKGDVLMTIEAMKMEQEIPAEKEGTIKKIFVAEGDSVNNGDLLMQLV
jgi:pyruvate carboxylase subunit B